MYNRLAVYLTVNGKMQRGEAVKSVVGQGEVKYLIICFKFYIHVDQLRHT